MRWLLTIVVLLASLTPCLAEDRLPSRPIEVPLAAVPDHGPWSFDLIDFRAGQRLLRLTPKADLDPHSVFVVKHHLGLAGGYENGVGRYPAVDRKTQRAFMQEQMTVLVSLTSAHYRVGYVSAWGLHCYLNLEQVFDLHESRTASQFGLSFSTR